MAWPVIEVVSAQPFCQVEHSKKPVTRKPQCSLALLGPRTPHTHTLPKLAWVAGVIRGDGGEKLELGVEAVFVYERRRFVKIKVKVFHCFA